MEGPSITQTIEKYLNTVRMARSVNTGRAYANGMRMFTAVLKENHLDPEQTPFQC